jgi:hypothetical protein
MVEEEREREEWWCHNGEIGLPWLRKRERERAGSSGGGNNGGRERDERRNKGRKRRGGDVLIN